MKAARYALRDVMQRRGEVDSHPGLLLQRYLHESAAGDHGNPQEKRDILDAAIRAAQNNSTRGLYHAAFDRWSTSLTADPEAVDLKTVGRLIVGLGTENVLETGITLHHTYGMPILPGSALKGLAAHYCDHVWGERDSQDPSKAALQFRGPRSADRKNNRPAEPVGDYYRLLFGTTDDSGCITFHDAWFVPDSERTPLKLDVMTPHHPKWNDLNDPIAPTDFDSPTPVPFLSVTGSFRVAVSWHGPTCAKAEGWTKLAHSLLCEALKDWGIGGKTTSGYGRLANPGDEALAQMSTMESAVELPKPGDRVEALLLEEKTKKGGWKAKHEHSGLSGHINNSADVPTDKTAGDQVQLIVASSSERGIAFRYPTAADEKRATKPKSKGSPGRGRPGRRR